jgi:prevent-host-death family protein
MMAEVGAREANQQFSKLLDRVEAGEEVVITKRGKAVAKLIPVAAADRAAFVREQERVQEFERLLQEMRENALHGGKIVDWTRDELYEREP